MKIKISLVVIFAIFIIFYESYIFALFPFWRNLSHNYQIVVGYASWVVIVCLALVFLYGLKLNLILGELGFNKSFVKGYGFAFIATLPMLISSALAAPVIKNVYSFEILQGVVLAPVLEEIAFRGFLFGQLFRRARWGFIPAVAVNSILFGLGHLYQASNLAGAIGTFLVTFLGGAWSAWMFIEWDENLWVPIGFHFFMNTSWLIFNVDNTGALGNVSLNLFRIFTIIISVVGTIWYCRRRNAFRITPKNLIRHA